MNIAEILELETITLVEPLFSDLIYQEMDDFMTGTTGTGGKILVDEDENPVLFAKSDGEGLWTGCITMFREPSLALIDLFEQFEWDMYQEDRETVSDAIREYYSVRLCDTVIPGPEDLNPTRAKSIEALLKKTVATQPDEICLDCCCGTGVGSLVLEKLGMHPLAYDNDESLLVRGIIEKRLRPERTMWIDGRMIHRFMKDKASLVCGFMIGEIHTFNAHIWQEIITAACRVSERALFTAGTEPEIHQIEEWMRDTGKKGEIFESDADPIYDRWVCYSE